MSNIISFPAAAAAISRTPLSGPPELPPGRNMVMGANAILFHQGAAITGGWRLDSGLVAIERVAEDGTRAVIKILRPGTLFPAADLLAGDTHSSSARTLTRVSLHVVAAARLYQAAAGDQALSLYLMRQALDDARESEDIIFTLSHADLGQRVLSILRTLASECGRPGAAGATVLALPMSWRDLAGMLGTCPEVMSRLIRKLAKAGSLAFKGRLVTLPSLSGPGGFERVIV
ncbi:MAG: Crp/Fnr family transcriptional regulator [Magnetospirillum sp.]|nr:MAG: Crp/Fnr family transcriptional regulator [Magnetospirillum sp.]